MTHDHSEPSTTEELREPLVSAARPRRVLRIVVGLVLVVGMISGWAVMGRQKAVRQAEAIERLRAAGASVYFDYQWRDSRPVPGGRPPEAGWVRRLVGDAMFDRAAAVDLRGVQDPDSLARLLLLLPYLTHINAADTQLTDASLAIWRPMRGLTSIDLRGTRVTADGVKPLKRLPKLKQLAVDPVAMSNDQ